MGDEILRMSTHLSKLAEKKMSGFTSRDRDEAEGKPTVGPKGGSTPRPPDRLEIKIELTDEQKKQLDEVLEKRKMRLPSESHPPAWFGQMLDRSRATDAMTAVQVLLGYIGENPDRDGLKDTPRRVVAAYTEMFSGYRVEVAKLFTVFDEKHDEMVVLKDIEFTSFCEHHMLPFTGRAAVGYVPDGRIVGVSKLARVLDAFAKRLQVQERITTQVTAALDENLKPLGSACLIEAQHYCMICRGVGKQNSVMVTSSMTGVFRDKPEARAEFFSCVRAGGK